MYLLLLHRVHPDGAACPRNRSPGQLTHNHQVRAFQYFRLQGGCILQAVKHIGRTQIGEQAQRFTDTEKSCFRTKLLRIVIPLRSADSPQQDGICTAADFQRIFRKRRSPLVNGNPSKQGVLCFKGIAEYFFRFFNTFSASATTSGPIPSPAITAIFLTSLISVTP